MLGWFIHILVTSCKCFQKLESFKPFERVVLCCSYFFNNWHRNNSMTTSSHASVCICNNLEGSRSFYPKQQNAVVFLPQPSLRTIFHLFQIHVSPVNQPFKHCFCIFLLKIPQIVIPLHLCSIPVMSIRTVFFSLKNDFQTLLTVFLLP